MPVRTRTLLTIIMPLLVACGYHAEQGQDGADVPENVARVLDHELSYRTVWLSQADGPEQAAAEFLEDVLGWASTDPVRVGPEPDDEEWSGDDAEVFDDPDRDRRRPIHVEAESPDGRSVGLGVQAGEATPPEGQPEQINDDRWRVIEFVIVADPQATWWLSLDVDADTLVVHEVPDEQHQSVLLLYQDGDHESFLLDELEPGADVEALELSELGFAVEEYRATGLLVHFDHDGRVLSAGGGNIQSATFGGR